MKAPDRPSSTRCSASSDGAGPNHHRAVSGLPTSMPLAPRPGANRERSPVFSLIYPSRDSSSRRFTPQSIELSIAIERTNRAVHRNRIPPTGAATADPPRACHSRTTTTIRGRDGPIPASKSSCGAATTSTRTRTTADLPVPGHGGIPGLTGAKRVSGTLQVLRIPTPAARRTCPWDRRPRPPTRRASRQGNFRDPVA